MSANLSSYANKVNIGFSVFDHIFYSDNSLAFGNVPVNFAALSTLLSARCQQYGVYISGMYIFFAFTISTWGGIIRGSLDFAQKNNPL